MTRFQACSAMGRISDAGVTEGSSRAYVAQVAFNMRYESMTINQLMLRKLRTHHIPNSNVRSSHPAQATNAYAPSNPPLPAYSVVQGHSESYSLRSAE